jgi:hypothetical protein
VVDGAGNVIVTGLSGDGLGYGLLTLSYDPMGTERWSHLYPAGQLARGELSAIPGLAVGVEGNATLGTQVWNGTDFDLAVLRYSRTGTLSWAYTLAGDPVGFDGAGSVAFDAQGAASVAGTTWRDATRGDGVLLHFDADPHPRDYHTVVPCRLFDSRDPGLGGPTPLAGHVTRTLKATGTCGIPDTARALALNVTVTGPTAPGNLRVYPGGFPAPNTSTANYSPGQTRANNAVTALGAGGQLGMLADQASGTVDVVLDVSGYFE